MILALGLCEADWVISHISRVLPSNEDIVVPHSVVDHCTCTADSLAHRVDMDKCGPLTVSMVKASAFL